MGQKIWKGGGVRKIWSLFRDRHTDTQNLPIIYIDYHGRWQRREQAAEARQDPTLFTSSGNSNHWRPASWLPSPPTDTLRWMLFRRLASPPPEGASRDWCDQRKLECRRNQQWSGGLSGADGLWGNPGAARNKGNTQIDTVMLCEVLTELCRIKICWNVCCRPCSTWRTMQRDLPNGRAFQSRHKKIINI